MQKIILDTNAYSAYRRGAEWVLEALGAADRVYLSVVVMAELFYGFKLGTQESRNRKELLSFTKKPHVRLVQITIETADIFSDIKSQLKQAGRPIPLNDVWIAAHCVELGAKLVSEDKHFSSINGLRLWK